MVGMTSLGDKASDRLATFVGSWRFVILQGIFLAIWFTLNVTFLAFAWDPYPFILANLFMSAEAAFTAPIIMMSQNRAAASDRSTLQHDVAVDLEALKILKEIRETLNGTH